MRTRRRRGRALASRPGRLRVPAPIYGKFDELTSGAPKRPVGDDVDGRWVARRPPPSYSKPALGAERNRI